MIRESQNYSETDRHSVWRPKFYDLLAGTILLGRGRAVRSSWLNLINVSAGDRVLDVGCGTGTLAIAAAHRVGATGRVEGLDPAPEMVAWARRKSRHIGPHLAFGVGVVQRLPFADAEFDVVLSSVMMHHVPRRAWASALVEMFRVLRSGGRLLIVDFGKRSESTPKPSMTASGTAAYAPYIEQAGFVDMRWENAAHPLLGAVRARRP